MRRAAVAQAYSDARKSFADAGVIHDRGHRRAGVEVDAHEDAVIVRGRSRIEKLGHDMLSVVRLLLFSLGLPVNLCETSVPLW